MEACKQLAQVQTKCGPRAERGKQTPTPTPYQEDICNWYPMVDEELVFFNDVLLSIQITHLEGIIPRSSCSTLNEVNNMFKDFFYIVLLYLGIFCLVGILLIYFCFHFLFL